MSEPSYQSISKPLSPNGILAQNLLLARVGAEWTQQELADASDVSRATIAQIEAGLGDPRLSTIELLARGLGIPTALLIFGQVEFHALATIASTPGPDNGAAALLPSKLRTMNYLVDSGNPRHRLEAARMGVDVLRQTGATDLPQTVGAAIGSARLPGRGTLLGARLAHLLRRPKVSGPAVQTSAANSVAKGIA
jgi:transcriptional regulator with XRE-family HTH domain